MHTVRVDPKQHKILSAAQANVRDVGHLVGAGAVDETFGLERVRSI